MRRKSKGYILVQVLVVVACLIALMAMLAANQHVTISNLSDTVQKRKAQLAAKSGLADAMATLEQANANVVMQTDPWYQLGTNGDQLFNMGDTSFRLQLLDAGALINVNTASQTELQQLPLTQEQVDCLLDWRSPGQTPRADGAKDQYYNGLPEPYNTRLGNLASLSELMLIKNWTARTLYSNQTDVTTSVTLPTDPQGNTLPLISLLTVDSGAPNTSATGGALVNMSAPNLNAGMLARLRLSPAVTTQIIARAPFTSFARLLAVPGVNTTIAKQLLDSCTFTTGTRSTGKVNLNTASAAVLETLPGVTPDIAGNIVSQQQTGFASLGTLADAPGISAATLRSIADSFTVGSDTWIVRAYGICSGYGSAIEAVVRLTGGRAEIQTWTPISAPGIPAWWGWRTDPTQTVDMETGQ